MAIYRVESASRPGLTWDTAINLSNGTVDCHCEHYEMTLLPRARNNHEKIDIGTIEYHCRHIRAAIADCIRIGDILPNGTNNFAALMNMATDVGLSYPDAKQFAIDAMTVLKRRVRKQLQHG